MKDIIGPNGAKSSAEPPQSTNIALQPLIGAGPKTTVNLGEIGGIPDMVDAALPALAKRPVFHNAQRLVHIARESKQVDGTWRDVGTPCIRKLPRSHLTNELNEATNWVRPGKKNGVLEPEEMPAAVVSTIADAGSWSHIRPLRGIAHYPIVRPDCSIATGHGYDPALQYILECPAVAIPTNPTRDDAKKAADELLKLIAEFPIESEPGRVVWLAFILTLLARPAIADPVPLFLFDAAKPGTGKTLAALCAALIVLGRIPSATAAPDDEAEWQRTLHGIFLSGAPVAFFDNLAGKLDSGQLAAALTSRIFCARVVRSPDVLDAIIQTVLFGSGNNVLLSPELARRSLACRMVAQEERPETRSGFAIEDLKDHVLRHRSRLLTCALTIFEAYRCAGCPKVSMPNFGSFEEWSSRVRAPLVWAGCADPYDTQRALYESAIEDDLAGVGELLAQWYEHYGNKPIILSRVVTDGHLDTPLTTICEGTGKKPGKEHPLTAQQLGYLLRKLKDQVIAGHQLRQGRKGNQGVPWLVVKLEKNESSPEKDKQDHSDE